MTTKRNFLKSLATLPLAFFPSKQSEAKEWKTLKLTSLSDEVNGSFSVIKENNIQDLKTWIDEDFEKNIKIIQETENELIFEIHGFYRIYRIYAHNAIEWNRSFSSVQSKKFLFPINCWSSSTMIMNVFEKSMFQEFEIKNQIPIFKYDKIISKENWNQMTKLIAKFEIESNQTS